jgi:surface-anchored protein
MKSKKMKSTLLTLATVVLAMISPATAQTIYTTGHWDISAHEHDGLLELSLHNHGLPEIALEGSVISYDFGASSRTPVSVGSSNLGLLYVSPEDEIAADASAMPFIGFSAEELASPFTGTVTFTMTGFTYTGSGTGNFYLFEGTSLFWDSSAGVGNYGSFSVNVGSHGHGEFGFSDLGLYVITLQASGNDGSPVSGESATFRFDVVPEPTCGTLLLTAFSVGMSLRRRFFRS